eukprot:425739-Prymnesium_polylepis.1
MTSIAQKGHARSGWTTPRACEQKIERAPAAVTQAAVATTHALTDTRGTSDAEDIARPVRVPRRRPLGGAVSQTAHRLERRHAEDAEQHAAAAPQVQLQEQPHDAALAAWDAPRRRHAAAHRPLLHRLRGRRRGEAAVEAAHVSEPARHERVCAVLDG